MKNKQEKKRVKLTESELLNSQTYKAPIWKVIRKFNFTIIIRLILIYLLSLLFDQIEMLKGTSVYLSLAVIEIIYYNYFNDEKNRP